jgi:hypothetical protein
MPIATRSTGETKDADADPDRRHPSQAGHDAPGVPALTPTRARLPGRREPSSDSALTQLPHSVRGDDGRGMIVRAAVALSYGRGGDAGADRPKRLPEVPQESLAIRLCPSTARCPACGRLTW